MRKLLLLGLVAGLLLFVAAPASAHQLAGITGDCNSVTAHFTRFSQADIAQGVDVIVSGARTASVHVSGSVGDFDVTVPLVPPLVAGETVNVNAMWATGQGSGSFTAPQHCTSSPTPTETPTPTPTQTTPPPTPTETTPPPTMTTPPPTQTSPPPFDCDDHPHRPSCKTPPVPTHRPPTGTAFTGPSLLLIGLGLAAFVLFVAGLGVLRASFIRRR